MIVVIRIIETDTSVTTGIGKMLTIVADLYSKVLQKYDLRPWFSLGE